MKRSMEPRPSLHAEDSKREAIPDESVRDETSHDGEAIGDSPLRWYLRGTAIGLLLMGSVNALSYFFRSSDWGSLVGETGRLRESVGFPFKVWEAGNTYGGMYADYPMLGWNVVVALLVGSLLGIWAAAKTRSLNELLDGLKFESDHRTHQPIQFSLRGLMVATLIAAVVATLARQYAARPETLVAIYALGPAVLVAIAMFPHRLTWQKRIMIIIPAAYALIGTAIAVGVAIGMEFDKVLMGIFLCWTPQSAFAAIALTASIFYALYRQQPSASELST